MLLLAIGYASRLVDDCTHFPSLFAPRNYTNASGLGLKELRLAQRPKGFHNRDLQAPGGYPDPQGTFAPLRRCRPWSNTSMNAASRGIGQMTKFRNQVSLLRRELAQEVLRPVERRRAFNHRPQALVAS
jgi:hypothetical protein